MPKFIIHVGVTLRSYGNVEVEADTIEAALKLLTADYVGENIDITETTKDSGQDLAIIDIKDAATGTEISGYDGTFLPSPYDPEPTGKTYRHSSDNCPSNHWNDGTDICADCGADLHA